MPDTTPTAEESRALLERYDSKQWQVSITHLASHLRAALDREAAEKARAEIAVADKFKMRDERDKAKIAASNYGNFSHDARKRAERAEAERDAALAEVERLKKLLRDYAKHEERAALKRGDPTPEPVRVVGGVSR